MGSMGGGEGGARIVVLGMGVGYPWVSPISSVRASRSLRQCRHCLLIFGQGIGAMARSGLARGLARLGRRGPLGSLEIPVTKSQPAALRAALRAGSIGPSARAFLRPESKGGLLRAGRGIGPGAG